MTVFPSKVNAEGHSALNIMLKICLNQGFKVPSLESGTFHIQITVFSFGKENKVIKCYI